MSPLRALPLLAVAVALSGCISLFPKEKPAQLYRFGQTPAAAPAGPAQAPATSQAAFGIIKPRAGFPRAAAGDRILTVNGDETAYIARARWVAPAVLLFEEATERAFDANPGPARIVTRGERRQSDYGLKLDVRRFEAVYDRGARTAPDIVVELRGVLTDAHNRDLLGERMFTVHVRAADNRVGAIVAAFDQATGQSLAQVVAWTNRRGAAEQASPSPAETLSSPGAAGAK